MAIQAQLQGDLQAPALASDDEASTAKAPKPAPLAVQAKAQIDGTLARSEEHTSELQSQSNLVCRLLLEKKKKNIASLTCGPTLPNRTSPGNAQTASTST